jgi:hypothetical protein
VETIMELEEPSAPGAIRLAGWRTPERVSHQIATRRHALTWTGCPMTARTAGARDDELDRFKNTKALPHRWLRPLDGGLPTGTAMTFKNKS